MARPRKPTAQLELAGAFKKNPDRRRPEEPKDGRPLGDPPDRLPAEVLPFWDEIVQMAGSVLTYRDRWAVELGARLMEKAVRTTNVEALLELIATAELGALEAKSLATQQTISSAELSTLRSLLAAMGMTPADRSKLSAPTSEKPKNKFTSLDEEEAFGGVSRPN